jgi:hypothetical protein
MEVLMGNHLQVEVSNWKIPCKWRLLAGKIIELNEGDTEKVIYKMVSNWTNQHH